MDRSSARSAPAGPSIRRRCLAGGPRCEFRSPKAARRDLSEGATRGLRLARNASSGASRRSRLASTSAGIVHATGAPAVEAPLPEEEDPAPAACRKRKRDATGHFAARKKAGGRVPKEAVPNEREWAEFRAKRDGAPLHELLDLFADDDKEE